MKRLFSLVVLILLLGCETTRYDIAFRELMQNEGGYVNHPKDPGGETKYGISKRYNPAINIKNIDLEFARKYYYEKFWHPMYERIHNARIALKLFDVSVHLGKEKMLELVNETLEYAFCNYDPSLMEKLNSSIVSNIFENESLTDLEELVIVEQVNVISPDLFLNLFKTRLCNYYCSRIEANDDLSVFFRGWVIRAFK